MHLIENVKTAELLGTGFTANAKLEDTVGFGRAKLNVYARRPSNRVLFDKAQSDLIVASPKLYAQIIAQGAILESDGRFSIPDPKSYRDEEMEEVWNQITNSGRDQLHLQGYSSVAAGGSAPSSSGTNWIALTNTAITPAAGDTTLSGEIVANGLSRAQGTYAHTAGTNTTTITNTFTCATSAQAAQAAALFNASSSGVMNHELTFTQRSLQVGDQLVVTYTITLG